MSLIEKSTIILGGGFTGLFTALHLSQKKYSNSVTLIDRYDRKRDLLLRLSATRASSLQLQSDDV